VFGIGKKLAASVRDGALLPNKPDEARRTERGEEAMHDEIEGKGIVNTVWGNDYIKFLKRD